MLNLTNNLFTLALGINTAACTLIGTQIGNMNVINAKNYMIAVVKFMLIVGFIEAVILWTMQQYIFNIFTTDKQIREIGHNIFWAVFIGIMLDFV